MTQTPTSNLLQGKYAIVTGGSRGIGAAIALNLATRGASGIVLTYLGSKSRTEEVAKQIEAYGAKAAFVQADILEPDFGPKVMAFALEKLNTKTIDIVVNNAALADLTAQKPFNDLDPEAFNKMFIANAYSPISLIRAALPHLPSAGGRVINISSIASRKPGPDPLMAYSASKAALDSFTRSLAAQYAAEKKATFNSISVGPTRTDAAAAVMDSMPEEVTKTFEHMQTAEHRFGEPEDIAVAVGWLTTEESRWINGASVAVNGGGMLDVQG